jgi:hypothetical protein
MATAIATRPPAQASKGAIWQLAGKYKSQIARIRKDNKETIARTTETVMGVGVGVGTSLGIGVLFAKFPKAKKIAGKVDTLLVGGGLFVALGAALKIQGNEWGGAVLEVGKGMFYPWAFMKGGELGGKF